MNPIVIQQAIPPVNPRQQGVALLLAVMVVAVATIIGIEIWHANQLDVARLANQREALQAEYYARGMALWAADVLRQDFEENGQMDTATDVWNQPVAGIAVPEGQLAGRLRELNGRFNLNNLLDSEGREQPQQVAFFRRLLKRLELDAGLADKILDWMDADRQVRPAGAEDFTYLARRQPYYSAGVPFFHVDELRALDGMDAASFETLRKHVTALPSHNTRLNLNTASVPLLLALDDQLSPRQAIVLHQQGQASFQSLQAFLQHPVLAGQPLAIDHLRQLAGVSSHWFEAASVIRMGPREHIFYALLKRQGSFAQPVVWSSRPFLP